MHATHVSFTFAHRRLCSVCPWSSRLVLVSWIQSNFCNVYSGNFLQGGLCWSKRSSLRLGSPGNPIPFPILSTSNRKNEKQLGFFSFSDLRCSKSIEGLTRLWQIRVKSCRIRVKNPFFFLGVSESIWVCRNRFNSLSHFEPFSMLSAKNPKFTRGRLLCFSIQRCCSRV